jgi:hypothetical protein
VNESLPWHYSLSSIDYNTIVQLMPHLEMIVPSICSSIKFETELLVMLITLDNTVSTNAIDGTNPSYAEEGVPARFCKDADDR